MKVTVIPANSLTPLHLAQWSAIQQADPNFASPYFSPEFTTTIAQVRRDSFVAILEESDQTVGFFPFQRERWNIGKPIGGKMSDYHGVIIKSGVDFDPRQLIRDCGLCVWDFDHLLAAQAPFTPFHRHVGGSPFLDLTQGYESYMTARRQAGTEQIKKMGTLMRKFEREVGTLRFEAHLADPAALQTCLKWKSAQYIRKGSLDLMSVPWVSQAIHRLHQVQTEHFAGMLSMLYAGDKPVAAHFGMRSKTVWHYWFPAYDVEYSKYSPGLALLLEMAKSAQSLGIGMIDMGAGDNPYKQRLMSGETMIAGGSVELPSMPAFVRSIRRGAEMCVRKSPLSTPIRAAVRYMRGSRKPAAPVQQPKASD